MSHAYSRLTPRLEQVRIEKARRDCPTSPMDARDLIEKALDDHPDAVVSWSGGRCSTAVLFLAQSVDPKVRVIFNDTGIEFSETYEFIKRISQAWNVNLQVLKPKRNFWSIVEEYGFPMLRGQYKDDSKSKDGRPMCCQILKEEPIAAAGISCCITGIRACESRMRMFAISQRGQYYYAKTLRRWNYHPIAFWSTEDLLAFHEEQNIPQNHIYSMGHQRCGCWPCTGFSSWKESLNKSHPKMYRLVCKMKGEPTLWEYQDLEGCKQEASA